MSPTLIARSRSRAQRFAVAAAALTATACGASDQRLDPADLELRDLLGVAPRTAAQWDGGQRAAARAVLVAALDDDATGAAAAALGPSLLRDDRIARSLARIDDDRADQGAGALALVRVDVDGLVVRAEVGPARAGAAVARGAASSPAIDLRLASTWDADAWGALATRGLDLMAALAADAGHRDGPIVAAPAPQLAVIAAYVAAAPVGSHAGADGLPHLLVNPVLLAALEPVAGEAPALAAAETGPAEEEAAPEPVEMQRATGSAAAPRVAPAASGNPYSFYGSIAECASAQRIRCEGCLSRSDCEPITDTADGDAECTQLGADGGRGYFLLCINLALAISEVQDCAADDAPGCPRDEDAARTLAELEQNARFLDDAACATPLDACLADLYGEPGGSFPPPGDAGVGDPPRDTSVSCGDSSANCEASPSCQTTGPSCGNSLSCDGVCSDSNTQSGCSGTCESCNSSSSSGGSSDSCGSCSSGDGGGGGGGGGDCGGSGSGGGGDCGGDCGGGDCGGSSDCGGGNCGGGSDCGGSCNSSSCSVAPRKRAPASLAFVIALAWAFLPVPLAAAARRRARRPKQEETP